MIIIHQQIYSPGRIQVVLFTLALPDHFLCLYQLPLFSVCTVRQRRPPKLVSLESSMDNVIKRWFVTHSLASEVLNIKNCVNHWLWLAHTEFFQEQEGKVIWEVIIRMGPFKTVGLWWSQKEWGKVCVNECSKELERSAATLNSCVWATVTSRARSAVRV